MFLTTHSSTLPTSKLTYMICLLTQLLSVHLAQDLPTHAIETNTLDLSAELIELVTTPSILAHAETAAASLARLRSATSVNAVHFDQFGSSEVNCECPLAPPLLLLASIASALRVTSWISSHSVLTSVHVNEFGTILLLWLSLDIRLGKRLWSRRHRAHGVSARVRTSARALRHQRVQRCQHQIVPTWAH